MDDFLRGIKLTILLIAAVFLFFTARLAWLQIVQHDDIGSRSGSIRRIREQAPRGHFIDRNGETVLENQALYTLKIIPNELRASSIPYLAYLLEIPVDELNEKVAEAKDYSPFAVSTVYRDLNEFVVARISENLWRLPGVIIEIEDKRKYSDLFRGTHMFGYLRSVNKTQLDTLAEKGYTPDDKIGFSGLERFYEEELRGEKGTRYELVNPLGMLVGKYNEGQSDIPSVKGNDLYLTIDAHLQQLAENLLRATGRQGAIVAIDPSTGGVLALCSEPDFDLDILNGKTRKKEWAEIALSPEKPLFNRAIQAVYPPGSTYKMVLAIAGLEEGVIKPENTILCTGSWNFGGRVFHCHGGHAHGIVNLKKAIIESCNIYFYQLMLKVGLDTWDKYGKMFGFGQQEGIDLPGERKGFLPTTDYYNKRYGEGRWTRGYLVSLGIGQGELGVTPLQLANYAATIANNGTWHEPHIVRGYRDTRTGIYVPIDHASRTLPVSKQTFGIIKEAMQGVVTQGTGTLAQIPGVTVAGKTGTAQNPHGKDHAWFICFAPVENPKIAIAVLVENAGFGGSISAPIAREMMNYYLVEKNKPKTKTADSTAVAKVKKLNNSLNTKQAAAKAAIDSTGTAPQSDLESGD
ncbi:penicillin-binding protein 2 [Chlorobaculum sp. MV4-Y]|uniref:penicillin-binding protein 2 n=1 Tax=Chlorobaculum sp. MV4-Y TaxID=2976335 RepID=UPI0021AE3B77|nr:penicillin-binding protein 2 [Chlorobaculum sp. MV4-Y]UWX57059.1 penicillin-binding protein 2 [Chlorobaculum sp. MV4-Y]